MSKHKRETRRAQAKRGSDALKHFPDNAQVSCDTLEFHHLADAFPLMEGPEFKEFVADIKAHGLREPITMFEGKILEGRNRYRACLRLKIEPRFEQFEGDGAAAAAFVMSRNIHRRHLTPKQKREAAAKLLKLRPERSDREIGRTIGVSKNTAASVRGEMESTGQIDQLNKRIGRDGRARTAVRRKRSRPRGTSPGAPTSFTTLPASSAAAPSVAAAKPERSDILVMDAWWAVAIADNNFEGARQIYALLTDDERRVAFTAALGRVINNDDHRAASIDVLARAIEAARNDEDAAEAGKKHLAAVEPASTAPSTTEGSANSNISTDGQWQIKLNKYVKGWSWFATDGNASMNGNPAALFATQGEAEADARAAIARSGVLQRRG
jgi:hypothetical protein